MKALIYKKPFLMEIEELEKPKPDKDEVVVKVEAVGACGSDVHGFAGKTGRRNPGMVMGHEIAGIISDVGSEGSKTLLGKSVVIQPIIYCGVCKLCKLGLTSVCLNKKMVGVNMGTNGGLSEYLIVPEKNIFEINQSVSPEIGTLVEPFAVGEGAASLVSNLISESNICIIGSGTIGLTTLLMVKKRKPRKIFIIDQNEKKLSIAKDFGAIPINYLKENPREIILDRTEGYGVDIVFEAVGVPSSVKTSMEVLRTGGTAVWVGNSVRFVEVDMQDMVVNMKNILGSYTYNDINFKEARDFVESNIDIASIFAEEVVPLSEANTLFTSLAKGEKELLRGIIKIG
jgi:threonine dehydrogenase-like Zn-dependent dehydrogenase